MVVVLAVFTQDRLEVPLIEDKYPVEAVGCKYSCSSHAWLACVSAKQSAQPRATPNRSRGAYSSQPAIRRVELESAVRSLIVVMVDILVQDPLLVTPV
jgi:hypothetical protein